LELEEPEVVQGDTEPARISRATEVAAIGAAAETLAEAAAFEEAEISPSEPEAAVLAQAGTGLDDDEAAFAWLESLAVRQGADEALMYTDEQRPVEPPEWVKQSALEAEMDISTTTVEVEAEQPEKPELEEQESTIPGWLIGAAAVGAAAGGEPSEKEPEETRSSLEEVSPTESPAATELPAEEHPGEVGVAVRTGASDDEMEAAFAWLESLAVRQGADEALMYTEEERSEKPPEWILEEQASAAPESREAIEHIPLENVALGAAAALAVGSAAEAEITPAEEAEEAIPDLPAWLADLEEEAPEPSEAGVWMPPEAPAYGQVDVNQASLIELERLPGVGFVRAQALIDYRDAHGPINSLEALSAIDEFDSDVIDGLRGYLIFPEAVQAETEITLEASQAAEITAPVETTQTAEDSQEELILEGAEADLLSQARSEIQQANPRAAQQRYQELIQVEKLLPQVVKDLQEALYRYPVDIPLWMTLGDAQMRSGHIQDALDAYTKAEELMR
jgi:DNA uptake protein ComE-like DNA-binding protein